MAHCHQRLQNLALHMGSESQPLRILHHLCGLVSGVALQCFQISGVMGLLRTVWGFTLQLSTVYNLSHINIQTHLLSLLYLLSCCSRCKKNKIMNRFQISLTVMTTWSVAPKSVELAL